MTVPNEIPQLAPVHEHSEQEVHPLYHLKSHLATDEWLSNAYIQMVDCKYEESFMLFEHLTLWFRQGLFYATLDAEYKRELIVYAGDLYHMVKFLSQFYLSNNPKVARAKALKEQQIASREKPF
jgi:hypothetical protein